MIYKKKILFDLDGVLNTYDGKFVEDFIPPINDGAAKILEDLSKKYEVVIFTSRNLLLTAKWVMDNGLDKFVSNVTNVKEPAFLMIDDRCLNFDGDFEKLEKEIDNFEVWYKK